MKEQVYTYRLYKGEKMKIQKSLSALAVASLVIVVSMAIISCAGSKSFQNNRAGKAGVSESKSLEPDYSGTYKLSDDQVCDIVIAIQKDNGGYAYLIKGTGLKSSGRLSIVKDGEETYLVFKSTIRSGDKTAVEGSYSDGRIMIQNTGNAMNQYICFKQCDVKFLEFVKE